MWDLLKSSSYIDGDIILLIGHKATGSVRGRQRELLYGRHYDCLGKTENCCELTHGTGRGRPCEGWREDRAEHTDPSVASNAPLTGKWAFQAPCLRSMACLKQTSSIIFFFSLKTFSSQSSLPALFKVLYPSSCFPLPAWAPLPDSPLAPPCFSTHGPHSCFSSSSPAPLPPSPLSGCVLVIPFLAEFLSAQSRWLIISVSQGRLTVPGRPLLQVKVTFRTSLQQIDSFKGQF